MPVQKCSSWTPGDGFVSSDSGPAAHCTSICMHHSVCIGASDVTASSEHCGPHRVNGESLRATSKVFFDSHFLHTLPRHLAINLGAELRMIYNISGITSYHGRKESFTVRHLSSRVDGTACTFPITGGQYYFRTFCHPKPPKSKQLAEADSQSDRQTDRQIRQQRRMR